ncbi:MAG: GAF domain-containing protein [Elusimicrobiota bacterium]
MAEQRRLIKKNTKPNTKRQGADKELLGALTKISEAITSDLYVEDILKLLVTITAEVMGSKICSLMLLDPKKNELEVRATQSVSEEYNKKPNIKLGQGIAGIVAETGRPIAVYDLKKDPRYLNVGIAAKEKLISLLSVPLIVKKKIIGVLNCYTEKPHKFSDNEITILKSVANQAAIVIENFRLVVESRVIKEELESRKMIERAKGILMKQRKFTEEEAYNHIRKFSMDNRKTMREIAEAIVLNADMNDALK